MAFANQLYTKLFAKLSVIVICFVVMTTGDIDLAGYQHEIESMPDMMHAMHKYRNMPEYEDLTLQMESLFLHSHIKDLVDIMRSTERNSVEHSSIFDDMLPTGTGEESTPSPNILSPQCTTHLLHFFHSLVQRKLWAVKMLDAWGKPPPGILELRVRSYGDFLECQEVNSDGTNTGEEESLRVKGMYCMAEFAVYQDTDLTLRASVNEGMCLPYACSQDDARLLVDHFLNATKSTNWYLSKKVTCHKGQQMDGPAIGSWIFLGVLLATVVLGTALDTLLSQTPVQGGITVKPDSNGHAPEVSHSATSVNATDDPESSANEYQPLLVKNAYSAKARKNILVKFFLCFSLRTNGPKLFDTSPASGPSMDCIHGLRLFTMMWIVLGHTILLTLGRAGNGIAYAERRVGRLIYQMFFNATFACDSFLAISGVLVCYNLLKALNHLKGKMKWHLFYLHRYLRLTPPMMLVMLFYMNTFQYWFDAPLWPQDGLKLGENCAATWWHNLFYIHNFFRIQCMSWTWYLAVDTQLYIISPIFVILLYRKPKVGFAAILCTCLASITGIAILVYKNNLAPSSFTVLEGNLTTKGNPYVDFYYAPWMRINPYLIGIVAGYILYSTDCKLRVPWILNILGWTTALVVSSLIVFGLYRCAVLVPDAVPATIAQSMFYVSLSRTAWGICTAWVIVMCVTGHGGIINSLLSFPALRPFGRATYMTYLIHEIMMLWFVYSQQSPVEVSDENILLLATSFLCTGYATAFVLSLLFEAPFMALEKLIFTVDKKQ